MSFVQANVLVDIVNLEGQDAQHSLKLAGEATKDERQIGETWTHVDGVIHSVHHCTLHRAVTLGWARHVGSTQADHGSTKLYETGHPSRMCTTGSRGWGGRLRGLARPGPEAARVVAIAGHLCGLEVFMRSKRVVAAIFNVGVEIKLPVRVSCHPQAQRCFWPRSGKLNERPPVGAARCVAQ